MTDPMTWAEIAERLGIPFAILLLILFALSGAFWAFFKWIAQPVTAAALQTLVHHREAVDVCRTHQALIEHHMVEQRTVLHDIRDSLRENGDLIRVQNGKLAEIYCCQREIVNATTGDAPEMV